MTNRTRIIVSILAGLLVGLCFIGYGQAVEERVSKNHKEALEEYGGEVVSVVVSTRELEQGDVIDKTSVEVQDWIADFVPKDAIVDIEQIQGKSVTIPLASHMPLTKLNFRKIEETRKIPKGYVGICIPLTQKLGIDQQVCGSNNACAYCVKESGVSLLASNIKIINSDANKSSNKTITLAVLPDDVPKILEASASSTLRIVRPAEDVVNLSKKDEERAESKVEAKSAKEDESR